MLARLAALALSLAAFTGAVRADDFYKGKTITIYVGATPSGSFDIVARALARRMGNYIPGNPSIVVQNIPGAASITALRAVETNSPREGLVMGVFLPGVLTQSLVTPEKVNVDMRGFVWVGVVSGDFSRVCYGYGPKGVASWDDLMLRGREQPFIMGTTGAGASNYINGQSLAQILGANLKIIMGFPGATELRLAIERGELEGDCSGFSGIPPDWIRDNRAHLFVRFAEKPTLGVPASAVYVGTLAKTDEQRRLLSFIYEADKLGRPFIASRQIPPERLDILRRAFDVTMRDEVFAGELARAQEIVAPMTGEEAEAVHSAMQRASPETVAAARKLYQ